MEQPFSRRHLAAMTAALLLGCGAEPEGPAEPGPSPDTARQEAVLAGPASFDLLMSKHSGVDLNADGVKEIDFLRFLPFEASQPPYASAKNGVVLVLVESRLLGLGTKAPSTALLNALDVYRQDLVNEGYYPRFIEAALYAGQMHQDGRTMLALRRFVKDVYANYPLRGTVLVGAFPDTTLVRRVMFKNEGVTKSIGGANVTNASTLTIVSEQIAVRADLVLSDLNGNWESLYVQGPQTFKDLELIPTILDTEPFPYSGQSFTSYQYNVWDSSYADFFYIRDESTTVTFGRMGEAFVSIQSIQDKNPELSSADLSLANPIARPEIEVTRINARHVATMPYVSVPTLDGQGPLAADGKPRAVPVNPDYGPWASVAWQPNAALEQRLLLDYFRRNHAFRTGSDRSKPYRVGAIRAFDSGLYAPADFAALLRAADPAFGTSVLRDNARMNDLVSWLKTPMTLRGVAAHSDWIGSEFAAALDSAALDSSVGGRPWRWLGRSVSATEYLLEPTLRDEGFADHRLYRTLWENGTLANAGQSFWLHDGCSVNSVDYGHLRYNDEWYGHRNHAESLLFFANALEVMARAKVFYDTPRNFGPSVAASRRFSTALAGYSQADASDAALNPSGAPTTDDRRGRILGRKRTYFWGVLGDFTLKLRY